jgi:hypothetical protein
MTGMTGKGKGVGERPGIGDGVISGFGGTIKATARISTASLQIGTWVDNNCTQQMDMLVYNQIVTQTMDCELVLGPDSRIPKEPVITVLLDAWSQSLDNVWMKMKTMSYAMRIENATSSELDEWWGTLYHVYRRVLEPDDDYRKRLQIYANMLKGSGTKENVEEMIDHILSEPGATTVTTYWPGTVEITFTETGSRLAKTKLPLLNYILPRTLAAGVSFRMPLQFIDYYMDMILSDARLYGSITARTLLIIPKQILYMSMLLSKDKDVSNTFLDVCLQKDFYISQLISACIQKNVDLSSEMSILIEKEAEKSYTISGLLKKEVDYLQYMDQHLLKDVSHAMTMTTNAQATRVQTQRMDMILS